MIQIPFQAKYGKNELVITLENETLRFPFELKYGKNIVPIEYGGTTYDVEFFLLYGEQIINVPITIHNKIYIDRATGLTDLFSEAFTIINQVPTSQSNSAIREWKKHVIRQCDKRDGIFDRATGTMAYKANSWTVSCKDWQTYRKPLWVDGGYYALTEYDKDRYWTANVGDLIIFADVDDVAPTTTQEFVALRTKYQNNGGTISSAQDYINYKPNGKAWKTNHIEMVKG